MSDEQETTPPAPAESPPTEPQERPADEQLEEQPQEAAEPPVGRYVPVAEAADHLGLSARTVRRRIDAGELQAKRADHSHAWLVWIEGLSEPPADDQHQDSTTSEAKDEPGQGRKGEGDDTAGGTAPATEQAIATLPVTTETVHALTDLVADLTSRNEALSMEVGASRERIRQLEGQLQALPVGEVPAAVKPWWKRVLGLD